MQGQLMKPLTGARLEVRHDQPVSAPQAQAPVVVMFSVPPALAKPKIWALGLVALVILIVGLFSAFGGDGGQAVIDAKDAHIQSLEQVNERFAAVAEKVAETQSVIHHDMIGYGVGLAGSALIIIVFGALFIMALDYRP